MLNWCEYSVSSFTLKLDSKSAKAIISRLGVGAVRHLAVKTLWIQHLAKTKVLKVVKVAGEDNHADIGTKVLARQRFQDLLRAMKVVRMHGAEEVPEQKAVGRIMTATGSAAIAESAARTIATPFAKIAEAVADKSRR